MHPSAMALGALFFKSYLSDASGKTVVDLGSRDVNGSLIQVCPDAASYIGVDFEAGEGVDVVLENPYQLPFADASVDVVVCSSVFEHSQFYWLAFLELMRILKPEGLLYLNVPSNGYIHRYPVDCWRFYPDAGRALVAWGEHNGYAPALLESFISNKSAGTLQSDPTSGWNDFVAVFVKEADCRKRYPQRILNFYTHYTNATCDLHAFDPKPSFFTEDFNIIKQRESALDEYQAALEQARQKAVNLAAKIAEGEKERTGLVQAINEARSSVEQERQALRALYSSNSWKATRPLRWAGTVAAPARRQLLRAVVGVRARGGLRGLFWIGVRVLRHEGAGSLLQRIYSRFRSVGAAQSKTTQAALDIPSIEVESISEGFTEYASNKPIKPSVKLIAFYLPQFHPFPENDKWWGRGFTEWSNVAKAVPNYQGHHQPHLPIHSGYYDLRVPQVMQEQVRLAKSYGIHGFNYYFYWFAGKILMDAPLRMMLNNPDLDMPFCLTWANENWTRRWDGQEQDVLIAQEHSTEDSLAFIRHLLKYFDDSRYIKVDGKPLLVIYRASIIPQMAATARLWREEVRAHGLPGLYLVCAQTFGIQDPDEFGCDAAMEFPPHTIKSHRINDQLQITNPDYAGNVFSYEQVVENVLRADEPDYKLFRTAMLSWDNTARKPNHSHTFHGFSLLRYKQWLSFICNQVISKCKYTVDEKLVFVNAWNEWAEGTHLEPDRKFGYGYLQATYDVLANHVEPTLSIEIDRPNKDNPLAAIVHVHYAQVLSALQPQLDTLVAVGCDLYFTATNTEAVKAIRVAYPNASIYQVENRGRDILPFIRVLAKLQSLGYEAVCKLHGKKSPYRVDGETIRDELSTALAGSTEQVAQLVGRFAEDPQLGLIVPEKYFIEHSDRNMTYNHQGVADACQQLGLEFARERFPAGSMYWFRPSALARLDVIQPADFDLESGLCDGTLPHALERLVALLVRDTGYRVEVC